jgi:hypothetical protein
MHWSNSRTRLGAGLDRGAGQRREPRETDARNLDRNPLFAVVPKRSNCVWFEGAILQHNTGDRIYAAPAPTSFGVIYDIRKEDIVEIVETGNKNRHLDRVYRLVRVYLKRETVLLRCQWMTAPEIPPDVDAMHAATPDYHAKGSDGSMVDRASHAKSLLDEEGGGGGEPGQIGGGPSPTPSPTPTPTPTPAPAPPPKSGVSGVRG